MNDNNTPIKVSWEDLQSRKVDARLKEQQAVARNQDYARLDPAKLPMAPTVRRSLLARLWFNSIFSMALFGLLGGLLGFGGWWVVQQLKPTDEAQARALWASEQHIQERLQAGRMVQESANAALREIHRQGAHNPYYRVYANRKLTADEATRAISRISGPDRIRGIIANALAYGVCGIMIAVFLAIAETIVERNWTGAIINGSVGAALGLIGGIAIALVFDRLYFTILGDASHLTLYRQIAARAVAYAAMGAFLTLAAGVVMRNAKRLIIGVSGGLIGGLLGGAVYDPLLGYYHNEMICRMAALVLIGLAAGAATGLIEQAAKSGWMRVVSGLIAGKQFILYRNPTFIGSGPDCQIYLFKDPHVGRRHAAVHIVPGAFELEDLPLGGPTLVNGRPISRVRLRTGDRIDIGATGFVFQEKQSAASA